MGSKRPPWRNRKRDKYHEWHYARSRPLADKNPIHPNAMRLRDLVPGKRVVIVLGKQLVNGVVVGQPRVSVTHVCSLIFLMGVAVRLEDGYTGYLDLHDLGVVPDKNGQWHQRHYMVAHNKIGVAFPRPAARTSTRRP